MNVSVLRRTPVRAALYLALIAGIAGLPAQAQNAAGCDDQRPETVNVVSTGTRAGSLPDTDTAAPVEALEATGALETGKLLQKLAPSFNFPTSFVSDGTDLI